jgi:hypothetical protein
MTFLHTIENERGSNSAVAVKALAGSLTLFGFLASKGESAVVSPAQASVGSPALLAVGWSNPDSGLSFGMFNGQTPFGRDGNNVFVIDDVLFNRVCDNNVVFSKGQLWSNPKAKDAKTTDSSNKHVYDRVAKAFVIENGLNQVKTIECESNRAPNQVAFGFENDFIIHKDILSVNTIAKKENA